MPSKVYIYDFLYAVEQTQKLYIKLPSQYHLIENFKCCLKSTNVH